MNKTSRTFLYGLVSMATLSFVPVAQAAKDDTLARAESYFVVTRPDLRKCAFPRCGGVFVKSVNQLFTLCADGHWQRECHAVTTDLTAIGLDEDTAAAFQTSFHDGQALVRGRLQQVPTADSTVVANTLIASEAWQGVAGTEPCGIFAGVSDSGLVCITTPCSSFDVSYLNTPVTGRLAEVDLAASGADEEAVNAGYEELFTSGILLAGDHYVVRGPGGRAVGIRASEFYHRVSARGCSIDSDDCAKQTYCAVPDGLCSEGKGTCQPLPEACLDIYDPVCGCDNQTYGNACYAASAGVSVASHGTCACKAMDAEGVGPCDRFFGWSFNGVECIGISGCSCEGADCESLFPELSDCEAACSGDEAR